MRSAKAKRVRGLNVLDKDKASERESGEKKGLLCNKKLHVHFEMTRRHWTARHVA